MDKQSSVSIVPIALYILSVCFSLMNVLCPSDKLLWGLILSVFSTGVYALFYVLKEKSLATMIAVVFFCTVIAAVFINAMITPSERDFLYFICGAPELFSIKFALEASVFFAVIIGYVCCYFSAASDKYCFLLPLMFIPFTISVKTGRALPVTLIAAMLASFIFIAAYRGIKRKKIFALTAAVSLACSALACAVPAVKTTPLERFIKGRYEFSVPTHNSSVNKGMSSPKGVELFTVRSDTPDSLYLTVNNYDYYNGKEGYWMYSLELNSVSGGWEYYGSRLDYRKLFDHGSKTVPSKLRITLSDNFSSERVIHPSNTFLVDSPGKTSRTLDGNIRFNSPATDYILYYYPKFEAFDPGIDMDEFSAVLSEAYNKGVISESDYSIYRDDLAAAADYREFTEEYISERITALAEKITKGLSGDLEKALALEHWFETQEFFYDMDYVPEKYDSDYFLFESRRGICIDYASALTLMAKAAGLPARYAEGFFLDGSTAVSDPSGGYIFKVTDENAHAFAQIYISGMGWTEFDATKYSIKEEKNSGSFPIAAVLAFIAGVLILTALFKIIPLKLFSPAGQIIFISRTAAKMAGKISGADWRTLTNGETETILNDNLGLYEDSARIRSAADKLLYSKDHNIEDRRALIASLIKLFRKKRRSHF